MLGKLLGRLVKRYYGSSRRTPLRKGASARLQFLQLEDRVTPALLGTAETFAVLAGASVTNTGATSIFGDLGVTPGLAITGFPPGLVSGGTIHANDGVAQQAMADVVTAYNTLAGEAASADLSGQDLGGKTLVAGVYFFSSSAQLTGTLTLDAQGVSASRFVFQIGSTLTTAPNSRVRLINTADGCNVYWQVGSSATLDSNTEFEGSILALASVTLVTGATIPQGRAFARNGSVTLDNNIITADCCNGSISGVKFNDHNGNGQQDSGDEGLAGWHITLNGVDRATTAADGAFTIVDLSSGTYTLQEVQQPGWTQTGGLAGYTVTIGSAQAATGINFGNFRNAAISGTVFNDRNGDGGQSPGDEGTPGVQVYVDVNRNNVFDAGEPNTVTDVNGTYAFTDLGPGTYLVRETPPPGTVQSTPNPTGQTPGSGATLTFVSFGNFTNPVVPGIPPIPGIPVVPGNPLLPAFPRFLPPFTVFDLPSKNLLLGATAMANANGSTLSQANFVSSLYQNILGRASDSAGLTGWVQLLQDGVSRESVAANFWRSAEHRGIQVDLFYRQLLHRTADAAGHSGWTNAMVNGTTELEVMRGFLGSDEYRAAHVSNAAFVSGLYRDVLNRDVDAAGLAGWTNALANGATGAAVAHGLLTSNEASRRVIIEDYSSYLGRSPDAAGLAAWANILSASGSYEAVALSFFGTEEYWLRSGQ